MLLRWAGAVVESFQDSAVEGCGSQGVAFGSTLCWVV